MLFLTCLITGFVFSTVFVSNPWEEANPNQYSKDEILVMLKEQTSMKNATSYLEARNDTYEIITDEVILINVKPNELQDTIKRLEDSHLYKYIQPNYQYEDATVCVEQYPYDSRQWYLHNDGSESIFDTTNYALVNETEGIDINCILAWDFLKEKKLNEVVVAVIDSGVEYTNKHFADKIWENEDEIDANGHDDDENGYVDDILGWNFFDNNNNILDYDGHGTHCAGILAANHKENSNIYGVAGDIPIKLMIIKALGGTRGQDIYEGGTSSVVKAIKYADANGATICNLSLVGTRNDPILKSTIESSSMLFICAAGNVASNLDKRPMYPAAFGCDNIITVANLECSGNLHSTSNYGLKSVDLAAPGTSIFSTYKNNTFARATGTSMAAPMVTATAAMIWSYYPDITPQEIKKRIINSTHPLNSLCGKVKSSGMLDVYKALTMDINDPTLKVKMTKYKKYSKVDVTVTDNGASGINTILWLEGKKDKSAFQRGKRGNEVNGSFTIKKAGYYTIYASDNNGNEVTKTVKVM